MHLLNVAVDVDSELALKQGCLDLGLGVAQAAGVDISLPHKVLTRRHLGCLSLLLWEMRLPAGHNSWCCVRYAAICGFALPFKLGRLGCVFRDLICFGDIAVRHDIHE